MHRERRASAEHRADMSAGCMCDGLAGGHIKKSNIAANTKKMNLMTSRRLRLIPYLLLLIIVVGICNNVFFAFFVSLSTNLSTSMQEEEHLYHDVDNDQTDKNAAQPKPKPVIAYAVSITGCDGQGTVNEDTNHINMGLFDAAAVLKHSIHLTSIRSRYSYQMYVFIHPIAVNCTLPLWPHLTNNLKYKILVRDTPINVTEIRGDFLREKVTRSGCCGEKELIKLWAYTLVNHPIVVHLDLDTIVLQPLDELFDAMLESSIENATDEARSKLAIMNGTSLPPLHQSIQAFFTRDYLMVDEGKKHVGVQGGFVVIRPNVTAFEEFRQIILEGNFVAGGGWDGKYGGYYGAQVSTPKIDL